MKYLPLILLMAFTLKAKALRIINGSGKWEPAFQNGHNVKTYNMQAINFRLE